MKISRWGAAVAVGAAVALALPAPASADLADDIASLTVAAEDRSGYERSAFGDYDRPALLASNEAAWEEDCAGYYSYGDDVCYAHSDFGGDPAVTDDEVDVDHVVPLAEAWDSGAGDLPQADRDAIASDSLNLWIMTDNLNQSKGAGDPAEWLPPHGAATCDYIERYVSVKIEYNLSVDEAELGALTDAAAGCDGGDPTPTVTASPDPEPEVTASPAATAGGGEQLPQTGTGSVVWLAFGGGALLLLGGGAALAARRRRVSFSA